MATNFYKLVSRTMPTFDFMIPKDGFYINTFGVSVTEDDKSYTEYEDAKFFILNKNSIPLYFYSLELTNFPIRGLSSELISNIDDEKYNTRIYNILYNNRIIGEFYLRMTSPYLTNSYESIQPFQSVEFSAKYIVQNIGRLGMHYFGKAGSRIGKIDFNLKVRCYKDKITRSNYVEEIIKLSVNVVNSGYKKVEIVNADSLLLPEIFTPE